MIGKPAFIRHFFLEFQGGSLARVMDFVNVVLPIQFPPQQRSSYLWLDKWFLDLWS